MTAWVVTAGVLSGVVIGVFGTLVYIAWKLRDTL